MEIMELSCQSSFPVCSPALLQSTEKAFLPPTKAFLRPGPLLATLEASDRKEDQIEEAPHPLGNVICRPMMNDYHNLITIISHLVPSS